MLNTVVVRHRQHQRKKMIVPFGKFAKQVDLPFRKLAEVPHDPVRVEHRIAVGTSAAVNPNVKIYVPCCVLNVLQVGRGYQRAID